MRGGVGVVPVERREQGKRGGEHVEHRVVLPERQHAEHQERLDRDAALKKLDAEIEAVKIRASIATKACKDEQRVLIDRNVKLSQDLIIAYRKLKGLESVTTDATQTEEGK